MQRWRSGGVACPFSIHFRNSAGNLRGCETLIFRKFPWQFAIAQHWLCRLAAHTCRLSYTARCAAGGAPFVPHMAQLAAFMRYQVHAAIPAITPKHAAGVRGHARGRSGGVCLQSGLWRAAGGGC